MITSFQHNGILDAVDCLTAKSQLQVHLIKNVSSTISHTKKLWEYGILAFFFLLTDFYFKKLWMLTYDNFYAMERLRGFFTFRSTDLMTDNLILRSYRQLSSLFYHFPSIFNLHKDISIHKNFNTINIILAPSFTSCNLFEFPTNSIKISTLKFLV